MVRISADSCQLSGEWLMVQCLIKAFCFVLTLIPHIRSWASYEAFFLCFSLGPIAQILLCDIASGHIRLDFPSAWHWDVAISFGLHSPNYMLVFEKTCFPVFLGAKSALWAQIDFLVSRKYTTSVILVSWICTLIEKHSKIDVLYQTIPGTREHGIIEHTQISLTSLTN